MSLDEMVEAMSLAYQETPTREKLLKRLADDLRPVFAADIAAARRDERKRCAAECDLIEAAYLDEQTSSNDAVARANAAMRCAERIRRLK